MAVKVLPPIRFMTHDPAVVRAAVRVAARGDAYLVARPGRETSACRFHRVPEVAGKGTMIGGRSTRLDRLGSEAGRSRDGQDDSAQAGGTAQGP